MLMDGVFCLRCVCVLLRNSKLELVDVERALSHDGWRALRCIVCECVCARARVHDRIVCEQ